MVDKSATTHLFCKAFSPVRRRGITAAALSALLGHGVAFAQAFPSRPIRLMLPTAPGGMMDLSNRLMSQKIQESTGQSWVLEHRPGANTKLSVMAVKNAAPDGYTLLAATPQLANNIHLSKSAGYRLEDFIPISLLYVGPLAMSVSKLAPVSNVLELIAYIKANPGKVNYASVGAGGTTQLVVKLLEKQYGLEMVEIPYKGGQQATQALMTGDVWIYFDAVAAALPQMQAGTIRIFGVTSEERMKGAPDLPTLKEQGVNLSAASWVGLFAPSGTPRPVVDTLHREVVKAVASSDFQSRMISGGQIPMSSPSPEDFQRFVISESDKWGRLIQQLKLQID